MQNQTSNPLFNYFRQPSIYLSLPSKGRWWPKESLNLKENYEIAIYPMSTKDEILLRTPDALLNGQGVVDVIQSCCPDIKNAWHVPTVDLDPILICIRIASYGNNMDFDTDCPHCKHHNTHGVDLGNILSQYKCPDYSKNASYRDLKIKMRPLNYLTVNKNNMNEFTEQKIMAVLNNTSLNDQDRANEVTSMIARIHSLGIDNCSSSTEYIETSDGERVTDQEFIKEFYSNAESALIKIIQDKIQDYAQEVTIPKLDLICGECKTPYQVSLTFDYSNFFVKGY